MTTRTKLGVAGTAGWLALALVLALYKSNREPPPLRSGVTFCRPHLASATRFTRSFRLRVLAHTHTRVRSVLPVRLPGLSSRQA